MFKFYPTAAAALLSFPAIGQDYPSAAATVDAPVYFGPGTNYEQTGTIPEGTLIAVDICFDEGAFCMRTPDFDGFVPGDLIEVNGHSLSEVEAEKWAAIRAKRSSPTFLDYEAQNIVVWGDSLSTDTFGDELEDMLLGRNVSMQGVPGEDATKIGARMLASTEYDPRIKIIWDRHYSGQSVASYIADIAPLVEKAAASGPFIVVSDVPDLDGDDTTPAAEDAALTAEINSALQAEYPENFIDMVPALNNPITRTDGLHLSPSGERAVATEIANFILAKGW